MASASSLDPAKAQLTAPPPPFIHFLATACLARLHTAAAILLVGATRDPRLARKYYGRLGEDLSSPGCARELDLRRYEAVLGRAVADARMIQRWRPLFAGAGEYRAFEDGLRAAYRLVEAVVLLWRHLRGGEAPGDARGPRVRDLRPNFAVPFEDVFGGSAGGGEQHGGGDSGDNVRFGEFRQVWAQYLGDGAPGLGRGYDRPWFVSAHVVPNGAVGLLRAWDADWNLLARFVDSMRAPGEGSFRYSHPPYFKSAATLDRSPAETFGRFSQMRPPVPRVDVENPLLDSFDTGGLAYVNRMLANIERRPDDPVSRHFALYTVRGYQNGFTWDLD